MAKATATCTCSECGATFIKTCDKRNRADADRWEAWAVDYFDECPACYGKRMRAAEEETPAYAELKLDVYKPCVFIVLRGNTKPIKDSLKAVGYRWDYEPAAGVLGLLSMSKSRMCWSKVVTLDDLESEFESLDGLGVTDIRRGFTSMDVEVYQQTKADKEAAAAEKQVKIDALVKPERPSFIAEGWKWNRTFYGKGKLTIYISGEKIDLTPEQKTEWIAYIDALDAYKAAVKEAKS